MKGRRAVAPRPGRLRVRPARAADAENIATAQLRMALETERMRLRPATVARGVRAALSDAAKGRYYVAERGGRFAGCLMITREWSDWRNGWIWWLQSLYVPPAERGRGVFRALYRRVLADARAARARGLRLYVDRRNAVAQRAYGAVGMDGGHYRVFERVLAPR